MTWREAEMRSYVKTHSSSWTRFGSLTKSVQLNNGTIVRLRPLTKEDEPRIHDLYATCSRATLFHRFHYSFRLTREWVADFCHADEEREVVIVAEPRLRDPQRLAGLCQLAFSSDEDSAEFAALIADDWQSQGLGTLMTEFCLELASAWGVRYVTAVTTPDNVRMTAVFKKLGFSLEYDGVNGVVWARKALSRSPAAKPLRSENELENEQRNGHYRHAGNESVDGKVSFSVPLGVRDQLVE